VTATDQLQQEVVMTRRKPPRSESLERPERERDLKETLMGIITRAPVTIDDDPAEAARLNAEIEKERAVLRKRRA
jgi:hypothetical protein